MMQDYRGRQLSEKAALAALGYGKKHEPMSISHTALAKARAGGRSTGPDPMAMDAATIFAPYKFAPGVLGADAIAQDECPGLPAGFGDWAASGLFHEGQGFFGFQYLAELFQRAEYRHAAEIWAEHAVRKWIEITGDSEETIEAVEREFERLRVRDRVQEWVLHDHSFGRGQIFLDFGDAGKNREISLPLLLDPKKINRDRPLQHLKVVEPLWSAPGTYNTNNPLAQDFYQPRDWIIYGRRVHTTRMLTITGRAVSDLLKPAYAFGGQALTQLMKPYVDNWLRARQSCSDMLNAYSVMNLKTDMSATMAGGSGDALFNRIDMFNITRDNRGCMVTDKDNEELENIAVPLSGLSDMLGQAQEQMASAARIPLSVFLQITPTGLNATNDGETRNFYADVMAYLEKNVRPALHVIFQVVQLSLFGAINPKLAFKFIPLWEMTDKDKADIRKSDADADQIYALAGAIDADDIRTRLNDDETSNYHGKLNGVAPGAPIVEEPEDDLEGDEG